MRLFIPNSLSPEAREKAEKITERLEELKDIREGRVCLLDENFED